MVGAHVAQQAHPRLVGHGHVAEHQVGRALLELGPRRRAAGRLLALVLVAFEDAAHQGAHLLVVVDDEDHGASASRTLSIRPAREKGFSIRLTPASRVPLEASTGCA